MIKNNKPIAFNFCLWKPFSLFFFLFYFFFFRCPEQLSSSRTTVVGPLVGSLCLLKLTFRVIKAYIPITYQTVVTEVTQSFNPSSQLVPQLEFYPQLQLSLWSDLIAFNFPNPTQRVLVKVQGAGSLAKTQMER